jgi:hypothetical protein
MLHQRWFSYVQAVGVIGALLLLAACSPAATTQTGIPAATATTAPTATATAVPPTATAALAPPTCGSNFTSTTYVTTLPDSTYKKTDVYAKVQLPPLTRSFDNDAAGGVRGRNMCSAGSTASVLDFMQTHLTSLGWQQVSMNGSDCMSAAAYGQEQCWKNGAYFLALAINSNTDWIIIYRDPDFA